jgi:Na+-driven multidrug efflux pump
VSHRMVRRILFYFTVFVCAPAIGWFIGGKNHAGAGAAIVFGIVLLVGIYLTFPRLVCPACGYALRNLGAPAHHCMKCGTAYANPVAETGTGEV